MEISGKDLVHLVRLALDGKSDDVAAMAKRLARKIQAESPETADSLSKLTKRLHRGQLARGNAIANMPVDLESRLELARVESGFTLPRDPIWTAQVEASLRQIVEERENEEALAGAELQPAKSLLFVGPPGVGKTLTARWLASQMHVPLVTLDLAAVMSSFLGRTGNNLRNVLDYAKGHNCILFLDEFDAIAKRRDDAVEVGELKRLVTVLLQEIDNWPAAGLLIAATNHRELLDPAVWRRFDLVVEFEMPDSQQVQDFVATMIPAHDVAIAAPLALAMHGMSFSDIEREILRTKRRAILAKQTLPESLETFISERVANFKKKDQIATAVQLSRVVGQRQAKKLTGVSRDTIRKETLAGEPEDDDG